MEKIVAVAQEDKPAIDAPSGGTSGVPSAVPIRSQDARKISMPQLSWKRIRGGLLFLVGYLLSPLCWWNDLIFNFPVAYGFGALCRWVSPDFFIPGLVAGYWLSNILGVLLMQFGALDALQKQSKPRNLRTELMTGVISSTLYTLVIVALVQFKVLDAPALLSGESLENLNSWLPSLLSKWKGQV
jgi:UDP-N-acetylmuramyl pentapeptide phosphotransferase/UDP-N-acetylglucosamine-1-phosphate transferase